MCVSSRAAAHPNAEQARDAVDGLIMVAVGNAASLGDTAATLGLRQGRECMLAP